MKSLLITVFLFAASLAAIAQENEITIGSDTATLDLKAFAKAIIAGKTDNYDKAKTLLGWLSNHFDWKATDYQDRTVKQIIVRKGGNCFEMATVYMALLKELNLTYRLIAEINIHVISEERGKNADEKIKQSGNRMSVFGRQHNDHRWVEIFDEKANEWIPADPTMNLIGYDQWLKGRAWFGERHTMNEEFNHDMIVPFAIYVVDPNNKGLMGESRTLYYMTTKLDALYGNKLSSLPSWDKWVNGLKAFADPTKNAFEGKENLHNYTKQISDLATVYQSLKQEWIASQKDTK
jgi:hypothetical protein